MKKFQFRLEAPLKWREQQEKEAKQHLQEKVHEQMQIEREISDCDHEIQKWIGAANEASMKGNDISEIMIIERYLVKLNERRRELVTDLQRAVACVEEAKEMLRETTRAREQLDYLKEKARKSYEYEMSAREQKHQDDAVSQRRWQGKNGGAE